jgi:hypothetical protein
VPWLTLYGIHKIVGDRWAGGFPPEAFARKGISYEASKQTKADIYRSALPLLTSGRVSLPKNERLTAQFASLERYVARGGHDVIDHPRDQHDDVCNACAGAMVLAAKPGYDASLSWVGPALTNAEWQRFRLHTFINSGGLIRL